MAGQDRFMNDFAPVTNASYIYAEAADGSQVKIKKSDLFSAVMLERGDVTESIDNYKETGLYGVNNDIFPVGIIAYGLLMVFKQSYAGGGNPIVQILVQCYPYTPKITYRTYWINGWQPWASISIT